MERPAIEFIDMQSYDVTADFDHVLLQLVDILNALLSGQLAFMTETFEL